MGRPGAEEADQLRRAMSTGAVLSLSGGLVTVVVALTSRTRELEQFRFAGILGAGIAALTGGVLMWAASRRPRRWQPAALIVLTTIAISFGIYYAGPDLPLGGIFYLWLVVWAFLYRPQRTAVLASVLVGVAYAVVLAAQDLAAPVGVWTFMMATTVMTGLVISSLVRRSDRLAERELAARLEIERAHGQLAAWSQTLEERVAEQVASLERLGGLRRFLSTPVADALLSGEHDDVLEPHRRQVAVVSCELHGLAAFAATSDHEELDEVHRTFFDLLGRHITRYEATVGGFSGDGLTAFFNDPIPVSDPVLRAVSMASDIQSEAAGPLARWRRQGFELDLGIGIAYGFASLGMIGFEGRRDYRALGPVVDLSAALSAEARAPEVLVDPQALDAARPSLEVVEQRPLERQGHGSPTLASSVRLVARSVGQGSPG